MCRQSVSNRSGGRLCSEAKQSLFPMGSGAPQGRLGFEHGRHKVTKFMNCLPADEGAKGAQKKSPGIRAFFAERLYMPL